MTLVDPGTPVKDARAAWVEDGAGPADAAAAAVAADATGVVHLPAKPGGGTVLAWAPGKAPFAIHVGAAVPFRVPMTDAAACDVIVTTSTGTGLAGADVLVDVAIPLAQAPYGVPPVHRYRVEAKTGSDGHAHLTGLPDVPLSVTAHAEGFVDAVLYPVDAKRGATLVLGRGSRVAGTLLLLPGNLPAAGATAKLGARVAKIAADGAFAFDTVPPGPYVLTFEGAGFVPPPAQTIVLADGQDRLKLDVTARRTSTLTGRVEAPKDAVVPALRLLFEYPPGAAPDLVREAFAKVGADGTFTVEDLPPCDGVALTASAPGFVAARLLGLSLPSGERAREVEVKLVPGALVTGKVVGDDDAPVAGATVAVSSDELGTHESVRTTTDAEGAFLADGVPAGSTWMRVIGRPVGGEMTFGPFVVAGAAPKDVGTLRAFAGWTLTGRVPGAPDGLAVVVRRDGADVAQTVVAAETFTVPGLPAGPVDVRVESSEDVVGQASAALPSAWPVTVPYDPPVVVHGRIVDATGRPVVLSTLRADRLDGQGSRRVHLREPEGRFVLKLLRGRWRLDADDGAGSGGVRELTLPADAASEVVLALERGAALRGTILRNGSPLEGAVIRAVVIGDRATRAAARTDPSGRFALGGVPPGVVKVRIETPDHAVYERNPVVVREAEDVDVGTIELPQGTRIRGEVRAVGGQPLARGLVEIECDGGTRRAAPTDAWGRFDLDGIPPGSAVVRVRDEGGALVRSQHVDVPWTWDDWPLRIDVEAGTRVFGSVQTAGRVEPFATVTLRLVDPSPTEVSVVTDAQGRYTLPPVPRGVGEIEVVVPGAAAPWRRPVRVTGGVDQLLDLDLPESSVTGTVESFDGGNSVATAKVTLVAPGDPRPVATAISDLVGNFELRRVREGTYDLVAESYGLGAAWVRGVVVAHGTDTTGVRVVLPPEGRLVLLARDDRYLGISTAWATAWRDADPDGLLRGPAVTAEADAAGRIVLRGLSRGNWRVALGAPGRARVDLGWVQVDEGERDLGGFELTRGSMLRVTAILGGPRGRRLGGVEVQILDSTGADPRPARRADDALRGPDPLYVTDRRGVLEVPGLAPGAYRIRPLGRRDAEIRVWVRAGSVVEAWLPVPFEPPEPDTP